MIFHSALLPIDELDLFRNTAVTPNDSVIKIIIAYECMIRAGYDAIEKSCLVRSSSSVARLFKNLAGPSHSATSLLLRAHSAVRLLALFGSKAQRKETI